MLLIEPISAITSWEDYEYQGHVALYIALKSILDLLQNGKSVSDYDLQIEGEEDFSIRKDCKYISLHQVKAGAIRLEQNDKFSFVIGILQNEAEYGYFHIANGKRIPVDFVSSTLTYISMLKNELKKKVIEKKDIADTDNEDNYIVLDKVSGNHKKHDILNTFSSGQLSGFVLAFLFAMNKQYIKASSDDIGFILIDDPVQTMDDINISSLIEVLRNDFSDKQIILSTHEMDKENYILYKFYKYNKVGQSFNVKEEIYG